MTDIFDMLNGVLDSVGVPKDGEQTVMNLEQRASDFKKVARLLAVISDPEEREREIAKCLKQAYRAGVDIADK